MDQRCFYAPNGHPHVRPDSADGTYSWIHIKANDVKVGSGGLQMAGPLNLLGNNILNAHNIQTSTLNGTTVTAGTLNGVPISSNGIALKDLSDATITNPQNSQVLAWNGSKWVNTDASAAASGVKSAFMRTTNASAVISANTATPVTFQTANFDINNDTTLNQFTAPSTGVYTFSTTLTVQNPAGTDVQVEVLANNVSVAKWRGNTNTISNSSNNQTTINISGTALLSQSEATLVKITSNASTTLVSGRFSGALLFSTINGNNVGGNP